MDHRTKNSFSLNQLYRTVGISKQAVHKYRIKQDLYDMQMEELVLMAQELREAHPGCGVEKMYYTLKPDFIGRDRFIEEMMRLGFRVKHPKNYKRTTYASSRWFPNYISGLILNRPNQVWQSDITYISVENKFYYAIFIIDVYTKEIVGFRTSDHMRATANLKALNGAIAKYGVPEIHHSDRGTQYTCNEYLSTLRSKSTIISMCMTAPENAYAERINRTIKEEYLHHWKPITYKDLQAQLNKAVYNYNHKRLHNHLNRTTPSAFREEVLSLDQHKRPTEIVYAEGLQEWGRTSSPAPSLAQKTSNLVCPNYFLTM